MNRSFDPRTIEGNGVVIDIEDSHGRRMNAVTATTDAVTGHVSLWSGSTQLVPATPVADTSGTQIDLSGITWTLAQTAQSGAAVASSGQITAQPNGGTVRISGNSNAGSQYVRLTGALPSSFYSRGMEVIVPVFIPDITKIASVLVSFSSDGYAAKQMYASYAPEFSGLHFIGLNDRVVQPLTGGQAYQSIGGEVSDGTLFTHVRLQVTLAASVTGAIVYVGKPVIGARGKGKIMLMMDDGESDIMEKLDSTRPYSVFQYLQTSGLKATFNLVYSLIGTAGYFTTSDIARILEAGHQICPHGATSLAGLANDAARRADIQANLTGLLSLGVPESMLLDCYVYPNGVFEVSAGDTTIMQILRDFGFRTARTAARRAHIPIDAGVHRQYHMPILGHYTDVGGGGETEAETLGAIEDICSSGSLGIEIFHKFVVGAAADTLETKYSSMLLFLDKIKAYKDAGALIDVTPSDLVRDYSLSVPATNTP